MRKPLRNYDGLPFTFVYYGLNFFSLSEAELLRGFYHKNKKDFENYNEIIMLLWPIGRPTKMVNIESTLETGVLTYYKEEEMDWFTLEHNNIEF